MNSIIGALGKFFKRDLLYIIGGTTIIFSILYSLNSLSIIEKHENTIWFILAYGYIVGYVVQETIALTGLILIRYPQPERFRFHVKFLYKLFTKKEFKVKQFIVVEHREKLLDTLSDRNFERHERIVHLKQIGATIGSNLFVTAIILFMNSKYNYSNFNISLAWITLIFSFLLIINNWIKGMQLMNFIWVNLDKPIDYEIEK